MNRYISSIIITTLTIFTSFSAQADTPVSEPTLQQTKFFPLNRVTFQLTAEQWVSTSSAKVIVGIDASLKEAQIGQTRANILKRLDQLVPKASWHITRFDRTEDSSGLAQLHVEAETRVAENTLGTLNEQAKKISTAGETYRILGIDFSPDTAEIEQIQSNLRTKLYNDAKAELTRLNSAYPDQKYFVHHIQFQGPVIPTSVALLSIGGNAKTAVEAPASLAVSNKVNMTAKVTLAANIQK